VSIKYPSIDPVAISVGPIHIRWYALAYLAGILLGWAYALYLQGLDKKQGQEDEAQRLTRTQIDDFVPWAILGVLLGGRIGYVLFYQPALYLADPAEILKIWHGGMSFHGGALGVILAMIGYAFYHKLPLLKLTDIVCACVPIGLFFGRIANFINGELFGRVSHLPWAMVFPEGGPDPRHPSQLYEAGLEGLVLFLILALLARRPGIRGRHGLVSGVFLLGYGCARMFLEFFRQPDAQLGFLIGGATMGQLLCLPMLAGGLFLIFYALRQKRAPLPQQ
jgi:phosphatidylglycerol:prolipoprotein diacylglycerol transferase